MVVIMDNNKTNQATYDSLCGDASFVMRGENPPIFLINNTVHILKCIRNNWITEKKQCIEYKLPNEDRIRIADWKVIIEMFETDGDAIMKTSKLTKKAVFTRHIERQNVALTANLL